MMAERRPGMPRENPAERGLGWSGQASFPGHDARTQPLRMSRSKAHVELAGGAGQVERSVGGDQGAEAWSSEAPPRLTFLGVHHASNEGHGGRGQALESREA